MEKIKVDASDGDLIGRKVIRGPSWSYGNQDLGSIYGIITEYDNISSEVGEEWYFVEWIAENGKILNKNTYECGKTRYSLYYHESESMYDKVTELLKNLEKLEKIYG